MLGCFKMLLRANHKIINVLFTVLQTYITREGKLQRYIINNKKKLLRVKLKYIPPHDIVHNNS